MSSNSLIEKHFTEHSNVISSSFKALGEKLGELPPKISDSLVSGGTLFLCGNGGSAADSQHISAELVGRFSINRKALRSIALTTDSSVLTCVANDFSYEKIFSRQIEALASKGDILLVISTSGNSLNIINALKTARSLGVCTIGFLGRGGGKAKELVNHALVVPSDSTARIQEVHSLMAHVLCDMIEKNLGLS